MNILLKELWMVFVLVILSDGVAALMAGRHCWRLRHRAQLAWPLAAFMSAVALVDLSDIANVAVNGIRNPGGFASYQALAGRMVRSLATWYLALKLMNGYSSRYTEEERDNATHEAHPADDQPTGPTNP